jgi:methylmalonyl-CoA decarboxylase
MPHIIASHESGVATLRLHDPARRNALGTEMLTELIAAFRALGPEVRAVILRAGPEDRVWCAGFDIAELAPGVDPLRHGGLLQEAFGCVRAFPGPVIAMLHGSAWGGGCDLALRCDIAVADPTCTLAFTPAKLGLPYDPAGLLNVLLSAGRAMAIEMFATAAPVAAERALRAGLVNHVVPEAELEAFTVEMARGIAALAPLSIAAAKTQLNALAEAMPLSSAQAEAIQAARARALGSEDYAEGLRAFAERRAPSFQGR